MERQKMRTKKLLVCKQNDKKREIEKNSATENEKCGSKISWNNKRNAKSKKWKNRRPRNDVTGKQRGKIVLSPQS